MKKERFKGEWILHKYIRIMPSVWIATMLTAFVNKSVLWYERIYPTHFWFVNAILCFFFIYWCFHQWIDMNPIKTILVVAIIHVIWYLIKVDHSTLSLDGPGINVWFYNFIFFLSGHYIANYSKKMDKKSGSYSISVDIQFSRLYLLKKICNSPLMIFWLNGCVPVLCVLLFFGYKILCKHYFQLCFWQFLVMPIILFLFTIYTYRFMNNLAILKVPHSIQYVLSYISNMTLDIYVVQVAIMFFVSRLELLFPLNIIVMLLLVGIAAYFCFMISNKVGKLITNKLIH